MHLDLGESVIFSTHKKQRDFFIKIPTISVLFLFELKSQINFVEKQQLIYTGSWYVTAHFFAFKHAN